MESLRFKLGPSLVQTVLQAIGVVTIFVISFNLLDFVYLYFLRPSQLHQYLIDPDDSTASKTQNVSERSEKGSWALVTGASDGIGKALAHELAQAGFNVVLHGRNPTKLDTVLKGLQADNARTVFRVLVADASKSHGMKSAITSMAKSVNSLPGPLTILINNVGGTSPTPQVFTPLRKLEHQELDGLVALNALFAAQLTRALLPGIITRNANTGAKAAIINIGSAAQIGVPMQSVYGGAKSFLRTFTCALARELSMEGYVDISAMYTVVGHVTYAGPWTEPPTLLTPTAVTFARSLLHKVGCGRIEVTPFWAHAGQLFVAYSIPEWLLTRFVTEEVRKDILKEEEKAKKV